MLSYTLISGIAKYVSPLKGFLSPLLNVKYCPEQGSSGKIPPSTMSVLTTVLARLKALLSSPTSIWEDPIDVCKKELLTEFRRSNECGVRAWLKLIYISFEKPSGLRVLISWSHLLLKPGPMTYYSSIHQSGAHSLVTVARSRMDSSSARALFSSISTFKVVI